MFIHIDCNNFFVSCELVSRPELKGTPVVVANDNGNNGGIILALNAEAKAVGLKRGNPLFQVTEIIEKKQVTVIDVHHHLYHEVSHHIMDEVRKTEMVLDFVQYSVDEFFGFMPEDDPTLLREYLQKLKDLIMEKTGIPVSCGAGLSYTLAKTATWFAKRYPAYKGICIMPADKRETALAKVPVKEVWGIGRRSIKKIETQGIQTALDYTHRSEAWVNRQFGITGVRTWKELKGVPAITLASHERQKSIMYSRTFAHMTSNKTLLLRELSNYASAATRRLREQGSLCQTVTLFLATNRHRADLPQYYADDTIRLSTATDDSAQVIQAVTVLLERIYKESYQYKQAGVILGQLQDNKGVQLDLFAADQVSEQAKQKRLMQAIDGINKRFGSNQIHFAIQGTEADQSEQPAGFMRPHKIEENEKNEG
ncbi:MAG: Y-family DNA polymerase [Paludibacteraceae bacterium]|nr:Y-family DNA polymerase [Paludibacteraceae bacterium]